MADRPALRRPLALATGLLFLVLGGLALVWSLWGEDLVLSASQGASVSWLNSIFDSGGRLPLEVGMEHAREYLWGLVAISASVYGLVVTVLMVRAMKRPRRWLLPALCVWWLGVENFAAPLLQRTLRLQHYAMIRDVDHRPQQAGPSMNSDGIRGAPESSEYRAEGLNLLFLGDSFTYGFKVKAQQAFPSLVGEQLRGALARDDVRIANFGWTSSSPLLSYRRLLDNGDDYKPDLVILNIDMTDFQDDIRWDNMLQRRGLYALYERMPIATRLANAWAPQLFKRALFASVGSPPMERFFITEAPLEETRPWFAPLVSNVEAIAAWCDERDVAFVLVILPRCYQYDEREAMDSWERERYTVMGPYSLEPFRFFEEYADGVDFPVVSLLPAFAGKQSYPTCFPSDPHWNAKGHRVAARAIAELLLPILREL